MDKQSIIETKLQLIEYFQDKEKNKKDWMIGTEHEKFIFSLKNFHSVDYKGENGIEKLLLILEKNSVLLSATNMDITDEVIKELNKQLPKIKVSLD